MLKITNLYLIGIDSWNRLVYRIENTNKLVKDISCGVDTLNSLYSFSRDGDTLEGEPDQLYNLKNHNVVFHEMKQRNQEREENKFIIAKMIAANEYDVNTDSIEWLSLASGINNTFLVKEILEELKDNPLELEYDAIDGWIEKNSKRYYQVKIQIENETTVFIAKAMHSNDILNYYTKNFQIDAININQINKSVAEHKANKGLPIINIHTTQELEQIEAMKFLNKYNLDGNEHFRYQMLSRLQMDCEYYIGNGKGYSKNLWADSEKEQIDIMINLYNSFPFEKKPKWISMNDILKYKDIMLNQKNKQRC